jgi:hypothetical protein
MLRRDVSHTLGLFPHTSTGHTRKTENAEHRHVARTVSILIFLSHKISGGSSSVTPSYAVVAVGATRLQLQVQETQVNRCA